MSYNSEQFNSWESLDDHLEFPNESFPRRITSGFLVVFKGDPADPGGYNPNRYPWKAGEAVFFLGEIPGMRGHGAFVGIDGLVKYGYHTFNFAVIPEEEL